MANELKPPVSVADTFDLLDRYRRQVAFYASAIERATGTPARPVLMKL